MPDFEECLRFFEFAPNHFEEYIQRCSTQEQWRVQFQTGLVFFLIGLALVLISIAAITYIEWRKNNGSH